MKKALMAMALLACSALASAAPVLTSMGVSGTGNHGTTSGTLTLTEATDLSLHLNANSALNGDLSFNTLKFTKGGTSYTFNVLENWLHTANGYTMSWDSPVVGLDSGVWVITLEWNDTQPGNASFKRSGFDLGMGQWHATAPPIITDPVANVPEPGTLALIGAGLLLMGITLRKRKHQRGVVSTR